jgi:hypothetical protein
MLCRRQAQEWNQERQAEDPDRQNRGGGESLWICRWRQRPLLDYRKLNAADFASPK